jgi:RHS repeat-associated protein
MVSQSGYLQDAKGRGIEIEDPNGNYISAVSEYQLYDTLGRQLGGLGEPNSQGSTSNYTITYTGDFNVKTAFGQSGINECPQGIACLVNAFQAITLPDGSSFSFTYDCDSTSGVAACASPGGQSAYYGNLLSMTLPTGGVVNYTWTTVTDPYGNKHRWLSSRTSAGGTWTYSVKNLSSCSQSQVGCQQQVTSTNPNGDYTIYTFTIDNGDWPVEVQRYNAAGTLMSTVNTTWDFSVACPWSGCHGHAYVRKLSETVTYPIPGGTSITKKTAYTYDSPQNGNVTAVQEWKFLPGTSPTFSAVPDRATYVTYYSAGTNIINKPQKTTLCNNQPGSDSDCPGGGLKVAQTIVTYDSYGTNGLTGLSGAFNHDDTNFGTGTTARGNPTQIQQWVNGTYLTTSRTYDTTGQVLSSTDPAGNKTTYSYADNFFNDNGSNPPQAYTPATPTNAYLTGVTLPAVNGVTMTASMGYYYGSGKRAVSTDVNGQSSYSHFVNPVTLVNDPFDRNTENVLPVGWNLTSYSSPTQADSYAAVADTSPSSSCSSCRHNEFVFDTWGRKVTEELYVPGGSTVSVNTIYDTNGRVSQVSHPGTSVYETFAYDGLNRKTSVTHPDNQSLRTAFGPNVTNLAGLSSQQLSPGTYGYGYPVISVDETGKPRQEWIDGFGNVIEVDEPSGSSAGTAPKATVTVSGSEGTHDVCHGDICVTHYDTGTVSITVSGYVASASWAGGSTSTSLASSLTSQLNSAQSPISASVNGSVITMTGLTPGAYTIPFSTSVTSPDNDDFAFSPASGNLSGGSGGLSSPVATAYAYDAAGRLTNVYQGVQTRTFVYDGLGRTTSVTTPEAKTDTLVYDSDTSCPTPNSFPGQLVKKLDARGIRTCFQYDTLNRLTGKNYSNGQGAVTYQYDQGGASQYALSRLTKITDPSGSETNTYDPAGRITKVQKVIGTTTYTTSYAYNAGGEITQITYPSGRQVTQNVDTIGRLSSITDTLNSVVTTRASSYSYNPAQQTLGFNYGNGVVASFLYDPNRQYLTNLSYTSGTQTLFSLKYYYQNDATNCTTGTTGSDGLINCISDLVDSGRTAAYTYDSLGRAVAAVTNGSTAYPKWGLSWAYDRYANRLSQTVTAGSGYNNSLTFANPGGAQTNQPDGMCFDASGNILAQTNATCPPTAPTYSYDAENQMTSYQSGSGAGGYVYDDHGKRVKKCLPNCTSPTSSTVYIFSAGKDVAEYDNGAAPASPSREYIYSGGTLISTLTSSSTTYHHSDHLSVRVSTDVNGNKIGEQGHYPYGESWYSANTTTKFIFTSYERDSESGNDYAAARYYLVSLGRFCSADPKHGSPGDPQSWNRYVYVRDNPINMADPSGLSWLSIFFKALLNLDPNIFNPLTSPISPSGSDNPWSELDNVLQPPMRLPPGGIIENWSPNAHDQMIWNALHPCGVSNSDIWLIQQGSRSVDSGSGSQSPEGAHWHAMANGTNGESSADAISQINALEQNSLGIAGMEYRAGAKYGATDPAMEQFGVAMHPVMDSLSPSHTDSEGNPIPWCGYGGCPGNKDQVADHSGTLEAFGHNFGDFGGFEQVGDLTSHPKIQDHANALIRAAYETMTGLKLNCTGN